MGALSPPGDTGLDRRRDVPEGGTDDASAERRTPCGIPPASTFNTTPAVAPEMSAVVVKRPCRRCRGAWRTRRSGTTRACGTGWTGLGSGAEGPQSPRVRARPHVPPAGRDAARERGVAGAPAGRTGLEVATAVPVATGFAPDDHGRPPGAQGGRVCRDAGDGRAGGLARP